MSNMQKPEKTSNNLHTEELVRRESNEDKVDSDDITCGDNKNYVKTDSEEVEGEKDFVVEYLKGKDLENRAVINYPPARSKASHHKSRFSSTWVFRESDYGYSYGGADPLNYDPSTKNRYIRIVFGIVLVWVTLTGLFNFAARMTALRSFFRDENVGFVVVPVAVALLLVNIAVNYSAFIRSTFLIYIFLILVLPGVWVVSGYISGKLNTLFITYAYGTMGFVAFVFIFIAFSGFDFTSWLLHIIALVAALPIVTISCVLAYNIQVERDRDPYELYIVVLFALGTFLFILIMTIMLQLCLSSPAVELCEEDYGSGAFYLYTSVYDIFFKIPLVIFSLFRSGGGDDE